jgi:hypothetical protein
MLTLERKATALSVTLVLESCLIMRLEQKGLANGLPAATDTKAKSALQKMVRKIDEDALQSEILRIPVQTVTRLWIQPWSSPINGWDSSSGHPDLLAGDFCSSPDKKDRNCASIVAGNTMGSLDIMVAIRPCRSFA